MKTEQTDIAIIGAGPSGAVAAALLHKQGLRVRVVEKQHFPRFVIGESLLPHCMEFIEEAGFLPTVQAESSFQFKNGAAFTWGNRYTEIDFTDKFTAGHGTTFQVRRAVFDQILINEATKQGVDVRFGETVTAFNPDTSELTVETENGETYVLQSQFVLDASGYGRVLPRLLDLETPSHLPMREAHFTHIDDNISAPDFDRNKILISTHPTHRDRVAVADSIWRQSLLHWRSGLARTLCWLGRFRANFENFCATSPHVGTHFGKRKLGQRISIPSNQRLFSKR